MNEKSYIYQMEEILNRVSESGLVSLDLADFKPKVTLAEIDIAAQLWQGLILKEKEFRAWIKAHDWMQYCENAVYIHCSADAIVPTWAYMLVASKLDGVAHDYCVGSKEDLEKMLIHRAISSISTTDFEDARVIIKGCSDISSPDFAMVELIKRLQPVTKSILYGEPCSTVPIFKKK
jgi:hypothetical protein